ncbi:hypothetical protein ACFQV8_10545 [Pseudonocardia benzenivorans]
MITPIARPRDAARRFLLLALVAAHLVLACALPAVAARSTRAAFGLAAVLPAVTLVWAAAMAPAVLGGAAVEENLAWAPALHLTFDVRLDALALVMIVLVSGSARSSWPTARSTSAGAAPTRAGPPRCCCSSRARCWASSSPTTC